MTRRAPQPDGLVTPTSPYSPVVVSGDLVFTSGQVAYDAVGAIVPGGIVSRHGGRSRTSARAFAPPTAHSQMC
jgi:enamine deaminase RidA (YjgF/YER057c/UK114 family)